MVDEKDHSASSFPSLSKQLASSTLGGSGDVPVVDLSVSDEELLVREVVKASEEWGVFQAVNHGIPDELMRQLKACGKQFFELPAAEKEKVAKEGDLEGYQRKYLGGIDGWDEHLFHKISPPSVINYKYWPKNPPNYREVTEEYTKHMQRLTNKILGWLSEGLGLPRETLTQNIGGDTAEYVLRINFYPPTQKSELAIGAPPHTDVGAIAFLVPNEVPGLQVFKDEQWFDLDYVNSAVVVIVGDQLMRLTNGRFKSMLHRAKSDKDRLRISWPVFVTPRGDVSIGPLSELTGEKNSPKFEPLIYNDYIKQKIRGWVLEDVERTGIDNDKRNKNWSNGNKKKSREVTTYS